MKLLRFIAWGIWIFLVCAFFVLLTVGLVTAIIQALAFLFTHYS